MLQVPQSEAWRVIVSEIRPEGKGYEKEKKGKKESILIRKNDLI